jgi:hypothetical protein
MNNKSSFTTVPIPAKIAVICFGIAGLLVAFGSILTSHQWPLTQSLALIALSIATASKKVRLTGTSTISLLTSTVLLALMVGGTGIAVIAGVCGVLTQTVLASKRLVFHQLAFNAGMIAVTVGATSGVFHLLLRQTDAGFVEQFLAAAIASLVYFTLNSTSIALIIGLSKRIPVVEVWRTHMVSTAPSFMIAGMLSLVVFRVLLSPAAGIMFAALPMMASVYYVSVGFSKPSLHQEGVR